MSERLPPIPTPSAQLWRQLRLQYLPVVIFVTGLLGAAVLWTQWVAPPTLVGEVEAVRTEVRSAQPGTLSGLEVELLQPVTAGQTLGHVFVNTPQFLETSLAAIRAEIEMIRATMDPVVGQRRAALDLERLRLDLMGKRVDLAVQQGELNQAETTLARTTALHRAKIITEDEYELAKNARDTLAAQIKAQTELINRLEPSIRRLSTEVDVSAPSLDQGLRAAIQHKEAELRMIEAELSPLPLNAPIDGVVTLIHRRTGENVTSGEPILQISATHSERIIGFLRQPLPLEPKPGMEVEVRTRTFIRRIGIARVAQVGPQLEPISPTLLAAMRLPVTAIPTDVGLRVHVTPPPGLSLRPGEQVDLIIRN
jgi:multidrug resistance efflux pump